MKSIIQFLTEAFKVNSKTVSKQDSNPDDPSTWQPGDILGGTFGYSMTLPIFYYIVKRTTSQFTLVKMSQKLASGHYNGSFEAVPDESKLKDDLKGTQIRARLSKGGGNYLKVDGHYMHLWDGKPIWGNDLD